MPTLSGTAIWMHLAMLVAVDELTAPETSTMQLVGGGSWAPSDPTFVRPERIIQVDDPAGLAKPTRSSTKQRLVPNSRRRVPAAGGRGYAQG
ncbi:hypothetical protein BD311DRAFT_751880 [Dichomitus squalens]|uniref:Secreted protein n=1 Tax=Dichomitus squalens TaxID=114155 RepID=A0A4Q9MYS1_9APHY|nr:hypothetical protein BD311DRAFT_751880 [Dichomitus squalens]